MNGDLPGHTGPMRQAETVQTRRSRNTGPQLWRQDMKTLLIPAAAAALLALAPMAALAKTSTNFSDAVVK